MAYKSDPETQRGISRAVALNNACILYQRKHNYSNADIVDTARYFYNEWLMMKEPMGEKNKEVVAGLADMLSVQPPEVTLLNNIKQAMKDNGMSIAKASKAIGMPKELMSAKLKQYGLLKTMRVDFDGAGKEIKREDVKEDK